MSELFETFQIRDLTLRNRIIRSATTSGWSKPDGVLRPEIVETLTRLAEGEVGLIIKGHMYVIESGKAYVGQAGITSESHLPMLQKLTNSIHSAGGVIMAQLSHAGINSSLNRLGPSDYAGTVRSNNIKARGLSSDEIWEIVYAFGDAAEKSVMAGFDAIQIHGAHGWLVSEFLSRYFNKRDDEWGGNLNRRMKILHEVFDEIRRKIGRKIPLSLKMNCDDFIPDSFTIDDSRIVAEEMSKKEIDLLEISGGSYLGQIVELRERARLNDPVLSEAYYAGYAAEIKKHVGKMLTALVGGIRSLACMEKIVDSNIADLVSMCRPFIRDQDLVIRLKSGESCSMCSSCDRHREVMRKSMLHCPIK